MSKGFFLWLAKAALAALLSLALLCGFCFFYYNVPVHFANPDGATEYRWEARRFYSKGTEGFAWGRTNNEGFNNLFAHDPGERVDLLLMGSSNMEGFNVAQGENAGAVLNALLGEEKTVYNIGVAGHTLLHCVKNLNAALDAYAPGELVIFETMVLDFAPEELDAVTQGNYPGIPSHSGGLLTLLQKLPFLRLFYTKYVKGESFGDTGEAAKPARDLAAYEAALSRFLDKIAAESAAHGVKALLVFSPGVHLSASGEACTDTDSEQLAIVSRLCEEKGVGFLDLTASYLAAYAEDAALPFGFSNTAPGEGHLNRVGHRLFAEGVSAWLREQEG